MPHSAIQAAPAGRSRVLPGAVATLWRIGGAAPYATDRRSWPRPLFDPNR